MSECCLISQSLIPLSTSAFAFLHLSHCVCVCGAHFRHKLWQFVQVVTQTYNFAI